MKQFDDLQSLQQSLSGLPQWASERILQQINQLTRYEPVIGIMGKTGVGKSSLCNALFAGEISPVSDVTACTREPLRFSLKVGKRFMTLVDLPGVGESERRDTEYAALYREQLPRLDLVLWLIKADDRALATDEHFYRQVSSASEMRCTVALAIMHIFELLPENPHHQHCCDGCGGGMAGCCCCLTWPCVITLDMTPPLKQDCSR